MPCAVSAAQGILCFRRWKAEKKLSLVVLPAAPAVGLVGGGGCGQPLADRRLKLGAGRTERRAGRAFCFAMDRAQRTVSLFEQLAGSLTAAEKSILGRCTELLYKPYLDRGCTGTPPTLKDFYRLLKMQPETEAQGLALSSELFITGTLNTFARHTNVNTRARIIDYDIRELGEQLMPLGMLVTLDAIYNRVIQNWKAGRRTWIVCDEFYRARRSVT